MSGEAGSSDPPDPDPSAPSPSPSPEAMPSTVFTRRRLVLTALFIGSCVAFLYFVLPKVLGLKDTWHRVQDGDLWWLIGAAILEGLSFAGYVFLFRGVFVRGRRRIGFKVSYEITMAGLVATRLFAAGGAGGIALTAWALRRSGMAPRVVAQGMVAFNALLYAVFMATLLLDGIGLFAGVLPGGGSFALTIVPAIIGGLAIAVFGAVSLVPGDFDRLVARWFHRESRFARFTTHAAAAPAAAAAGIRTALRLVRARDPQLLGAVAWWGFDAAVLWASFHAFGPAPKVPVIIMCYFLGQLGNLLPLPGGIGGVDGALIGSFTAFGVSGSLAVVAVLAYRAFAFWLPTVPGVIAYLQLRRTVHHWEDATPASYT